jgi:uncharacterized membrane protein (UPF0127 family)
MRRVMLAACGAALFVTALAGPAVDARKPAAKATLARVPLTIRTAAGVRRFQVEVARSEEEQAQGLMFRTSVPAGTGMIFPMSPPRVATFWMKNTLVPLDMIFVRADGTIARIAANTQPMSLDMVPSGEPVAAVLEIAGGAAASHGIREGDKVQWKG